MIVFDEKILAAWFIKLGPDQDWLCGLRELEPDAKYEINYRFRYYTDDEVFESKDVKNWYHGEVTGTRNYCVFAIRSLCEQMAAVAPKQPEDGAIGRVYECLMDEKGLSDFLRRWQEFPFVYMRQNPVH
jgi:hypothetical protein